MKDRLSLQELAGAAGVTPRTVRYYISEGLLSSPDRGPRAGYDPDQLARLRLIRQLQRNHLPLAEIRRQLNDLSDAEVHEVLTAPRDAHERQSALAYIRSVLEEPARTGFDAPQTTPDGLAARRGGVPMAPARAASVQPDRSHWDRVSLSPDVELHIRRPLTRGQNRAVGRLIGLARQLLEEE